MDALSIGIYSTVIGTLIVTAALSFNAFVWQRRGRIKSKFVGWYEHRFGNTKEAKYTVGAVEYIKDFKHWADKTEKGISIILPYFHVEMPYDNVIGIRILRSNTSSGHIMEVMFREGRQPKSKHFFGITDEAIAKVARRIYFQEVVGK